jgi:cytochrome c-type protein NapC
MTTSAGGHGSPLCTKIGRWWALLREHWRIALALVGAAFIGWAGFATWITVIEYTNHTEFCMTCHIMRDTVGAEFKESTHFKNKHGFHASCPDCHVPQYSWIDEAVVKFATIKELYAFFFQGINNAAAFEKVRPELAKEVWAKFKTTNARECRHCHDYTSMVFDLQKPSARVSHQDAMKTDQNCVDCHKGITHKPVQVEAPAGAPAKTESFDVD